MRYLVDGLEHHSYVSIIYGIILPIDELIYFKMVKTTNQLYTYTVVLDAHIYE